MTVRRVELAQILNVIGDYVVAVYGPNENVFIDNLADAEHTIATTFDWVNSTKKDKQSIAEKSAAKVICVDKDVVYSETLQQQGKTLIVVSNPRTVIAIVATNFFVEKRKPEIHPTAIISTDAIIGNNVYIGPYCVIGKAKIGDNCVIESNVRIHDGVEIGHDCNIFDHVVLGGQSFGPMKDENGNLFRFPQLGHLKIGNYVEIASMTCVDKGALSDTTIGDYTKIDSLCKVSHNNVIGKNVVITGCVSIAGSNIIEDGAWIGPNSSLKEWGHIGKDSLVGIGAVVLRKVKPCTKVFGNPSKEIGL